METTRNVDLSADMRQCVDDCLECHAICEHTAGHCLDMGGAHASRDHQRTLRDCAQICLTSADFMLRRSPIHGLTCAACAQACRRCAEECERLGRDDATMTLCAQVCRRCGESCRGMAEHAVAD